MSPKSEILVEHELALMFNVAAFLKCSHCFPVAMEACHTA